MTSLKYLFLFSLPSILSSLLEPLSGLVDTALVGRLDSTWLGALAIAVTLFNSFTWMFNFLVHASTQTISKSYAVSQSEDLCSKIKVALSLALLLGILSGLGLYLFRLPLFRFTGATEELIPLIESYFFIRLIGHPFTLLYTTMTSILRGMTKVKFCFYLILFTTLLNILVSWFLLFQLNWGLEGAAVGTVTANVVGFFLSFIYIFKEKEVREKFFMVTPINWDHVFHFGKNSLNVFGRSFFLTSAFYLSTKMSASIGVETVAAHQILVQVWLFSSFFLDGIAITGNILGAKYLEEKAYDILNLVYQRLLLLGLIIGAIFTLVFFLFQNPIMGIFTKDPVIIEILMGVWFLMAMTQVPNALAFVYDGLLFGLEAFDYLRKHMIIGVLVIFLPFALSVHWKKSLLLLWIGLSLLNIYRLISGHSGTKKRTQFNV